MNQIDDFGQSWALAPDGIKPDDATGPTRAEERERVAVLQRLSNPSLPGIDPGIEGWRRQLETARARARAAKEGL